jgi:glycine betaine/choline ABC-type transport system substrate-binding protein
MKQASISLQEPKQSLSQYFIPVTYFDEVTKEKIQKHLNDINDVITEEDIRNIDTSITIKQKKQSSTAKMF